MKIQIPNKLTTNTFNVLRKAGYLQIFDRQSGKKSFVRKLSTGHYPRFHVYVIEANNQITIDMHLDQTKTRYEGQTAHGADYDSEEVKNELKRVFEFFKQYIPEKPKVPEENQKPASEKKSWFQRFLEF